MTKLGANNKEWWTEERRQQHSIKIKNSSRPKIKKGRPNLPSDFNERCRKGQISYHEKNDKLIMETKPFKEWPIRLIKKQLFLENGNKCQKCEFEYTDQKTGKGPFQIHHKDGNKNNWEKQNLQILCLNCHWMTPNFAFKGRCHTEKTKKILAEKTKNYHLNKTILRGDAAVAE